jgi:flagellar biosynthesis activator protein FlaF
MSQTLHAEPTYAELTPNRPISASRAYGQVIRQTETPREIEHRVFAQITAGLESVSVTPLPGTRAEAISRNRELWRLLTFAALDDNNALPVRLRANIIGLGRWVERECARTLRDNAPLDGLIETNRIIMRGLAPAVPGAPPCP